MRRCIDCHQDVSWNLPWVCRQARDGSRVTLCGGCASRYATPTGREARLRRALLEAAGLGAKSGVQ
jgi:hypothetical protein